MIERTLFHIFVKSTAAETPMFVARSGRPLTPAELISS